MNCKCIFVLLAAGVGQVIASVGTSMSYALVFGPTKNGNTPLTPLMTVQQEIPLIIVLAFASFISGEILVWASVPACGSPPDPPDARRRDRQAIFLIYGSWGFMGIAFLFELTSLIVALGEPYTVTVVVTGPLNTLLQIGVWLFVAAMLIQFVAIQISIFTKVVISASAASSTTVY